MRRPRTISAQISRPSDLWIRKNNLTILIVLQSITKTEKKNIKQTIHRTKLQRRKQKKKRRKRNRLKERKNLTYDKVPQKIQKYLNLNNVIRSGKIIIKIACRDFVGV